MSVLFVEGLGEGYGRMAASSCVEPLKRLEKPNTHARPDEYH
jgi:hypothetical protein